MSIATSRAAALADQYTQAIADLLAVVEPATLAQWRTPCINEGRSVGVLVHHIGTMAGVIRAFVEQVVQGESLPPLTQEMIDHNNARHAETYANAGPDETLALLRHNSAAAAAFIASLSEAQLNMGTALPAFNLSQASAGQMVEFLLIGHTLGHLASIQSAIAL